MEQNKQQFTCPMHPDVIRDAAGKCPICGMNLVPVKLSEEYYCPMGCEGDKKYPNPGKCPVCGMNLVKVSG
jgi:Cu2+-exporting ATPase